MNELQAIVKGTEAARREGKPALLATVVSVRGSAYRRPGARMLLTSDGWEAGSISGGCLEGDILRKAWWRTRSGEQVIVTYDSTADDGTGEDELSWGFGLGCNGVIDVLLERIVPGSNDCPVVFIADCLRRRRMGLLATVIAVENSVSTAIGQRLLWHEGDSFPIGCTLCDDGLATPIKRDANRILTTGSSSTVAVYELENGGTATVFLEVIRPPRPLLICGAGHDAAPLARMADALGWQVTVVEPRPGMLPRPDRFPGAESVFACSPTVLETHVALDSDTCVVVMSHNVALDAALLAELLPSSVRYIGILGPRRRTERILASLRESGVALPNLSRLHGPVGLDIGADNPETIALSILAEVQASITKRCGGFLRERDEPIHEPMGKPISRSSYSISRNAIHEPILCTMTTAVSAS